MKLHPRAGIYIPALLTLAACNIVTDGAPIWDMTWNVPSKSTSISVNSLLPSGVTLAPSGTAFQSSVSSIAPIVRTLGTDCSTCAATNGLVVPKPAFTVNASSSATLPSTVGSATLITDTIIVVITNGYNFDPIRPGAGNVGSIQLTARSGTTTLGTQTFSGATFSIPAGATSAPFKLPISGNVGSTGIQVTATIDSPAGDPILMDANRQITITPSVKGSTTGSVLISSANVTLNNQLVNAAPTNLDLSGIDESVKKRTLGGKLFLTITNPFGVGGNLTMNVSGVTKTVALTAGSASAPASLVTIDFTSAEIQKILGTNGSITFGGTVSGATAVLPGQTVAVATRLQLTLCTESSSDNSCK